MARLTCGNASKKYFFVLCIAIDFDVPGARGDKFDPLYHTEIMGKVKKWIPTRLGHITKTIKGKAPPAPDQKEDRKAYWKWHVRYDQWRQGQFARLFDQWMYAQHWDRRYGMFGRRDNIRCGYRGMQLGEAGYWPEGHEHEEPVSLVFLDYHF